MAPRPQLMFRLLNESYISDKTSYFPPEILLTNLYPAISLQHSWYSSSQLLSFYSVAFQAQIPCDNGLVPSAATGKSHLSSSTVLANLTAPIGNTDFSIKE